MASNQDKWEFYKDTKGGVAMATNSSERKNRRIIERGLQEP